MYKKPGAENLEIQERARLIADALRSGELTVQTNDADFSSSLQQAVQNQNLFDITLPEKYGGEGGDILDLIAVLQTLAAADAGIAVILAHHAMAVHVLVTYGNSVKRVENIFNSLDDEPSLAVLALKGSIHSLESEKSAVTAQFSKDSYSLNGTKRLVPCGHGAQLYILTAGITKETEEHETGLFVVSKDAAGLKIGKKINTVGLKDVSFCDLQFQDCIVPRGCRIEGEFDQLKMLRKLQSYSNILYGAIALGVAESALMKSLGYSKERHQFHQPISEFSAIREKLAKMGTHLESARLLVSQAGELWKDGKHTISHASMAKYFASKTAMESATEAVQIHGGYGYLTENNIDVLMRDAKMLEILGVDHKRQMTDIADVLLASQESQRQV